MLIVQNPNDICVPFIITFIIGLFLSWATSAPLQALQAIQALQALQGMLAFTKHSYHNLCPTSIHRHPGGATGIYVFPKKICTLVYSLRFCTYRISQIERDLSTQRDLNTRRRDMKSRRDINPRRDLDPRRDLNPLYY